MSRNPRYQRDTLSGTLDALDAARDADADKLSGRLTLDALTLSGTLDADAQATRNIIGYSQE